MQAAAHDGGQDGAGGSLLPGDDPHAALSNAVNESEDSNQVSGHHPDDTAAHHQPGEGSGADLNEAAASGPANPQEAALPSPSSSGTRDALESSGTAQEAVGDTSDGGAAGSGAEREGLAPSALAEQRKTSNAEEVTAINSSGSAASSDVQVQQWQAERARLVAEQQRLATQVGSCPCCGYCVSSLCL